MDRNSSRDLETIQKGLEEFLEKEVEGYQSGGRRTKGRGREGQQEIRLDMLGESEQPRTPGKAVRRRIIIEEYPADEDPYGEDGDYDIRYEYGGNGRGGSRKTQNSRGKNTKKAAAGAKRTSSGGRQAPPEAGKGKKRKKSSFWKKFLIVLLILLLVLGGLWYYFVGRIYEEMNYEEIESLTKEPMKEAGVTNILLIGNDSRSNGEDGRSDAMILVSISNATKTIYMTSLLRDMYVEIPGHDNNRLNAAYSFGGAELLMETIEKNFDIPVNRYVLVNFQAFANLVDAVGGVDLELTNEEVLYVNGYLWEYNILENRPEGTDYFDESLSGMIHLNGPQALAYCRNRYIGTDFGRTERQRKVLSAIVKQTPQALLKNSGELMDGLLPNLTTNLTREECLLLSLQAPKVVTYDIEQNSIPIAGSYSNATIRKMAVLEVDFEKNKEFIRRNIYGEGRTEESGE